MSTASFNTAMPQEPAHTASLPNQADFPPKYESKVNENLRNFGDVEGQVNNVLFDRIQECKDEKKRSRNKKLFFGLIAVLIVAVLGIVIIATTTSKKPHDENPLPVSPSRAAEVRSQLSTATVTSQPSTITVTQHLTTTKLATTTLSTTTTATASIPESIAKAASAYYSQVSSMRSEILQSANEAVSAPLTMSFPSTTLATALTTPTPEASDTATSIPGEDAPSETDTRSLGHMINFCGLPGFPCLRK